MPREEAIFHAATLFIAAQNTAGLDDRKRQIIVSAAFDLAELTADEHEKRMVARDAKAKADADAARAAADAEKTTPTPPAP